MKLDQIIQDSTFPDVSAKPDKGASRKILIVVDSVFPGIGGAEIQARLHSASFAALGHEVSVLAPLLLASHPLREMLDGVPVERIAYPKIKLLGALILCMRFALVLLMRRRQYDAIHVHTADILAAVAGIMRPFIKACVTVKVSGAWEFEGGILDPAHRTSWFYRFLNGCLRRADYIQCISEHTRQMVLDAGYSATQVSMIPNAVDLRRFNPSELPFDKPVVVFVGRLVPVKGLSVLIAAWQHVLGQANATLIIAGDGPERAALQSQVRQLGVESRVQFLGSLTDVVPVLAQACMYVQASFQEGMPNSVLEAMASGLPIVATRVSGNEDLVTDGQNGLLVSPGDHLALAEAILAMLAQPEMARRMGQVSRQIVESKYSTEAVMQSLLHIYGQPRK
jgi:glycosyltransferase involved in cell wall biosynthesis